MQTHRGKMLKDFLIYLLPVHNRGNYQKKNSKDIQYFLHGVQKQFEYHMTVKN